MERDAAVLTTSSRGKICCAIAADDKRIAPITEAVYRDPRCICQSMLASSMFVDTHTSYGSNQEAVPPETSEAETARGSTFADRAAPWRWIAIVYSQ